VARYVVVDDRDGRVLAELASAEQAARMLGVLARSPDEDASRVSVVRLEHQQTSLTEVTSIMSMRPLPPLMGASLLGPMRSGPRRR
jgi:hypothetical protein